MHGGTEMVVAELNQVHELARKLSELLEPSQIEICKTLAGEIVFSIEKAIYAAKTTESLFSKGGGHHVARLNQEFSEKEQKISKKRKMLPNRTRQVRVVAEPGADVPPDDGHSWRKYGQKDILGARHPRAYYRCTHRKTQGCVAMKQVQKSEENSSIFDVTYLGIHSCVNSPQQTASNARHYEPQKSLLDQQSSLILHFDFQDNLKVKTESLEFEKQDPIFSRSYAPTAVDGLKQGNAMVCSALSIEEGYGGIISSALMSPTRSGSNCFPWTTCEMSIQADSGVAEINSAAVSVLNSPVMDVEFMLEYGEMDTEILFDPSSFFL